VNAAKDGFDDASTGRLRRNVKTAPAVVAHARKSPFGEKATHDSGRRQSEGGCNTRTRRKRSPAVLAGVTAAAAAVLFNAAGGRGGGVVPAFASSVLEGRKGGRAEGRKGGRKDYMKEGKVADSGGGDDSD
jgi:hypothetical protein